MPSASAARAISSTVFRPSEYDGVAVDRALHVVRRRSDRAGRVPAAAASISPASSRSSGGMNARPSARYSAGSSASGRSARPDAAVPVERDPGGERPLRELGDVRLGAGGVHPGRREVAARRHGPHVDRKAASGTQRRRLVSSCSVTAAVAGKPTACAIAAAGSRGRDHHVEPVRPSRPGGAARRPARPGRRPGDRRRYARKRSPWAAASGSSTASPCAARRVDGLEDAALGPRDRSRARRARRRTRTRRAAAARLVMPSASCSARMRAQAEHGAQLEDARRIAARAGARAAGSVPVSSSSPMVCARRAPIPGTVVSRPAFASWPQVAGDGFDGLRAAAVGPRAIARRRPRPRAAARSRAARAPRANRSSRGVGRRAMGSVRRL